ncbi:unnamed protein product [Bursaphelenchus okinawaensis]|uniref:Acyl-coenzyme A thioesterase 13 n=1 Tax=Bursaphelenchus okinawaensis TaxID=465554 RepID=A0A811K8D9_9BILA|nr:unnamed protein product [Bursaphelenchus okinawaensis]CAG9093111.1 unnamed protein product [Bursaphelenchus okinawaensis]
MAGKYVDVVRKAISFCCQQQNFSKIVDKCSVISAEPNNLKVEFTVTEDLTNGWKTLHGGCTATLVDMITTMVLYTTDDEKVHPGVSVDMALSYYGPAQLGDKVIIDATIIRKGRTLAYTKADLYLKDSLKPVAFGTHTKAFPPVKK